MVCWRVLILLPLLALLVSCVSPGTFNKKHTVLARTVNPAYVSPSKYSALNCNQIFDETQNVTRVANDISSKLERGDYDQSGGAFISPFLIVIDNTNKLDSTNEKVAELAQLKGQLVALKESANQSKCTSN